jgi:diadenosine tetraphosphate (Ap4A) HIT family hydrolase
MKQQPASCMICDKHNGAFQPPGGALFQDEWVYASHAHLAENQENVYLGWLVVETRRHIPGLAELNDREAQALGLLVARLSRLLKVLQDAEHVYLFVLGHGVPHLHLHLLPRYPDTPRAYWGPDIDEWPEAARGDEYEISALCERLRASLAGKETGLCFGEIQSLELGDLRPNNWYINRDKLASVRQAWERGEGDRLPPVLVSRIDGQLSLIDGHARAYAALERGENRIQARVQALDEIEGSQALYRHIHRRGPAIGVKHITDLGERILPPDEHERLWVGYCQVWIKENITG